MMKELTAWLDTQGITYVRIDAEVVDIPETGTTTTCGRNSVSIFSNTLVARGLFNTMYHLSISVFTPPTNCLTVQELWKSGAVRLPGSDKRPWVSAIETRWRQP